MRTRFPILLLLAAFVVVAGGCQKLNFEKTENVPMGLTKDYTFDPPTYEQKVKVTIAPTSGSVSAYLFKVSDKDAIEQALNHEKEPPASLLLGSRVSKGEAETYSFDATVPAKTTYMLMLKGHKKSTDVKVKVVGR